MQVLTGSDGTDVFIFVNAWYDVCHREITQQMFLQGNILRRITDV